MQCAFRLIGHHLSQTIQYLATDTTPYTTHHHEFYSIGPHTHGLDNSTTVDSGRIHSGAILLYEEVSNDVLYCVLL